MRLTEVRAEDDLYYKGPFWVIADSVLDLQLGRFRIVGNKNLCTYEGKYLEVSKNSQSHVHAWKDFPESGKHPEYNYYPRGRVEIYNDNAIIHINSICNTPKIVDSIVAFYELQKLTNRLYVEENDITQGSHYDFLLK